jgi:hypothetical protein
MELRYMTEEEYNAIPGIRRSSLHKMAQSPMHYKHALTEAHKDSPALAFGRALHMAVLEPELFEKSYAVAPSISKATKAGRTAWELFEADAAGREIITQADYDKVLEMRESIMANPLAAELLSGAHEQACYWVDDMTGLACKVKLDAVLDIGDRIVVADIKTCTDASTEAFMRDAVKHGYDFQSGMYTEGVAVDTGKEADFVFIAIEKQPPYAVNVLAADKCFVLRGKDLFREYLGKVAECEASGVWWQYNADGINELKLPYYLQKEYE